jgi:predicted transposase/invertase (TIGR01784 family)
LDPKNDLIFKRIFGGNPDLLISFLNALLPLEPGQEIESIEYLTPEIVPKTPLKKNSIVDVRCHDNRGRQFIVEMQMEWTTSFTKRMVFNASKAYVGQMKSGEAYPLLRPVYGLAILNDIYDSKTEEFYHHYQIVDRQNTDDVIREIEFVFVELPKFKAEKWADRRMAVLWLRFLREMRDQCTVVDSELLADERIHRALDICQEAAFSREELAAYDQYWDIISTEKTLIIDSLEKGRTEGLSEGRTEGEWKKTVEVVINSHKAGIPAESIAAICGLTTAKVDKILAGEK